MRQITQSRRLTEVKKKILPSLAGISDPTFNNEDHYYCARLETDFKKKKDSNKTGKESTVKTVTPVKYIKVIHY